MATTRAAPLVFWYFVLYGILLVVPLIFTQSSSTLEDLCLRLKTDPTNVTLQGVSPVGATLYLVSQNIIFTVPFTTDYIDTVHGVIGLYERKPQQAPQVLGEWFRVSWMRSTSGISAHRDSHLLQLSFWSQGIGTSTNVTVTVKSGYDTFDQIQVHNGSRHSSSEIISEQDSLYGLVSDGAGLGYRFGFNDQGDAIQLVPEPQDPNESQVYYPSLSQNLGNVTFGSNSTAANLLVSELPVFGFIYNEVVHLWDMNKSRVAMFVYQKGKLDGSKQVRIWMKPYSEYFACSEQDWSEAMKDISNPLPIEASSNHGEWMIPGVILVIGLGAAVGSALYLQRQRSKKKRSNISNMNSTLGSSSYIGSEFSSTRNRSWAVKSTSKKVGHKASKLVTLNCNTKQQVSPKKPTGSSFTGSSPAGTTRSADSQRSSRGAAKTPVVKSQTFSTKSLGIPRTSVDLYQSNS